MNIGLSTWVQIFWKKFIFRADNANMINRNAQKCIKALSDVRFDHTSTRKKSTMGRNLLILSKSSNLYRNWDANESACVQRFLKKFILREDNANMINRNA